MILCVSNHRLLGHLECKQLISVCQLLYNPHDDNALMYILKQPLALKGRLGPAFIKKLEDSQAARRQPTPLWEIMLEFITLPSYISPPHLAGVTKMVKWRHKYAPVVPL